ncbi:hypothetical protein RND81_05G152300 [Saponaria officinalis]|uniref:S-protein homolog n=1 Tax=Saponaria officinalis TaxID=3572 RepID=A0AAW1KZF2_SAPOF
MISTTKNHFLLLIFAHTLILPISFSILTVNDNKKLQMPWDLDICYTLMPETTVHITHILGQNVVLNVHCKSKDDDLGEQVLTQGISYEFRFRPNFWGTTLFFCNFSWEGRSQSCTIYEYNRDIDRCCDICMWSVDSTGVHGYNKHTGKADVSICPW